MTMLSKKNIFRIILVLIPLGLFFILELILRITGYENDLNFVSRVERNGKEYYTLNQLVGKRYFGKDRLYYRKGSHDYFEVNKSPNTIRVFCFGESSMAGFPYEYNAIPSEFLRERLRAALPGKNIEVINTAIAATNSFTVDEFANVLVKYKPDLFVVYMGQNEFYGVYGVGSTLSAGKSRWVIKTYLWFEQFKTFLLLKNAINYVERLFETDDSGENKILMEEMASKSIKYNSDDFKIAVNTFRDNYDEVIKTALDNKIPILISTLVTNENDLQPFVSFNQENLNSFLKEESKGLFETGLNEQQHGDFESAADNFKKSLAIDSTPAIVHYQLGKCYEKLNLISEAGKQYSCAIDLDGLRFRAPSVFDKIIENLGDEYKVPVADVRKEFRQNSANGFIGSGLLVDHVHPNVKGYFLLAKTWFETLKDNRMLGLSSNFTENDSLLWDKSGVTHLDSLIGELKIMELRSRPPFTKSDEPLKFEPQNYIEQLAYQYAAEHSVAWAAAHLNASKYYLSAGNILGALNELKAILISDEDNPMVLKLAGDMSLHLNLYEQAEKYYIDASKFEVNQFIDYKLGKTELLLDKPDAAVQFLQSSLDRNAQSNDKFNSVEIEDVYLSLAKSYSKMNEYEKAADVLEKLLSIDPLNKEAKDLINKISKH